MSDEAKRLLIDGEWVDSGRRFTVVEPGSGDTVAEVASAGQVETQRALEAAGRALPDWSKRPAIERADLLLGVAAQLERRRDQIGRLIVLENGKPLAQALGEVAMTIDHLRWFAEEARRAYGRIVPHQVAGKRHLVLRRPIGVVAAIAPWNFPLVLAVRKVAPALAAGCPTILRPARQTPLSALALAESMQAAGLPRGVFQLLCGPAEPIVAELIASPLCRKISFTGSTEIGESLMIAAASTHTKLSLELGGHAPFLLFADADLERAVEGALIAKFRNNGQSCIAANRFYVERSIYEPFLKRFGERISGLVVGHGLEEGVDVSCLINRAGLELAEAHIADACERGARLLCGGKRLRRAGNYLAPTLLADVADAARCMQEETFAPVAAVRAFDHEEEALAAANSGRYGLAAYAYTSDLNRALRVAEGIEAGSIGLNDAVPSTSIAPFGGYKASGQGRELGSEGLDAFLETTHVSIGGLQ